MIVPAGPGSSVLTEWPESGSLPGSPGRPAYFSLLVQWHLDRAAASDGAALLERDLSAHRDSGQFECWRDSETPGTAFSGKGPCIGLLKPKVKRRHWLQNVDVSTHARGIQVIRP